jgi:hypothetical protein
MQINVQTEIALFYLCNNNQYQARNYLNIQIYHIITYLICTIYSISTFHLAIQDFKELLVHIKFYIECICNQKNIL